MCIYGDFFDPRITYWTSHEAIALRNRCVPEESLSERDRTHHFVRHVPILLLGSRTLES